jgi:hypothetical protein
VIEMANITVTEAAGFIPEIWAATALGALKANTVMARLVNRNFESDIARQGDIIRVPRRGTLSVNSKAANTVVTLQTPTADTVNLTLNQHKEVSFLVEDIAAAQANQSIIAGYVEDGMKAIGEEIDADLLALYTGFSATPIDGTSGSGGITAATVTEARRILNAAKVPQSDRYIVWHEDAEAELLDVEKFTSSDFGDNGDAIREAIIGRKYGFSHFMDQNVVVATGECKNLAFHRDAIMLATRPLPAPPEGTGAQSSVMNEDGFSIRVTYAWNASYLAMQVTLDVLYGVAELRDNHAVVIRSTEA